MNTQKHSCLVWSKEDFNGDEQLMNKFFTECDSVIIESINEIKNIWMLDNSNDSRECSNCGAKNLTDGYVFRGGENHACSDSCRDAICEQVYQTTWSEEYDEDGDSYYTEFEQD